MQNEAKPDKKERKDGEEENQKIQVMPKWEDKVCNESDSALTVRGSLESPLSLNMYVFGLCEKLEYLKKTLLKHRDNMQTPHQ